jgi:hypothetical protein
MSSSTESTSPFESRFPELNIPPHGWESNIPAHLLDSCDEQTRWLMEEISKNTQATNFASQGVSDISRHLRELNGRVGKQEAKLSKDRDDIDTLKAQVKAATPLIKPLEYLMALWEFRAFRWVFYAAIFFFFTYLLPWYISNPPSLTHVFDAIFGGK